MSISKKEILDNTHNGLTIYAYVLREFYPGEFVISLSGKECQPTKNPFNNGEPTLRIFNQHDVFYFEDTCNKNFQGDPFDFAGLYFNLAENELYTKINEVLSLQIGEKHPFFDRKKSEAIPNGSKFWCVPKSPIFSYYRRPITNTKPTEEFSLLDIYNLVKSKRFIEETNTLRTLTQKSESRKYKAQNFDYVTFSGIFSERCDKALQKHSGLLAIDFDQIQDIDGLRQALLMDKYFDTEIMFVSPSGDGLKWIIPIDLTQGSHANYFKAVANYILHSYSTEIDKSGKDVSRACFLPYDKNVYINPKYLQS